MESSFSACQTPERGRHPETDPIRLIFDLGQALREEMPYRLNHSLPMAALISSNKLLLEPQGKAPHLGMLGYAQRILPVVDLITQRREPLRILDAGCGYGTESILFSLLGARVTGVELVPDRAALAESRVEFYQSYFRRPMWLKFINANIFSYLKKASVFDLIWAMEAISHIHPAEMFLEQTREHLSPDGLLVISDANTLNPKAWLDGVFLKGTLKQILHRDFKDPATGLPVDYAEERRFTLTGMIRKLKSTGFHIKKVHMCGFMGTTIFPQYLIRRPWPAYFLYSLQKMLLKTPFKFLGSIYTIVAVKQGD